MDDSLLKADSNEVHKMLKKVQLDKNNFRCTKCRNPVYQPKECQECGYFICSICWDNLTIKECGWAECNANISDAKTVKKQNTLDLLNDCLVLVKCKCFRAR